MLLELRAENYAVIDHAVATFGSGLNLLTGETGAGKSILVDALALLMGGRAASDVVRHGAEKAVVSCVFEATPGAEAILEANGIDVEGAEILLRREVNISGKGRVFLNNQPATVGVLRQLAPELALVHAQSETTNSFDQSQQRGLLDRYAGIQTALLPGRELSSDLRARLKTRKGIDSAQAGENIRTAYTMWREAREELDRLSGEEQERLRNADLWSFQRTEIAEAAISSADEDEQLESEKRVLANAEKLYTAAMSAHEVLYENEGSAESTLAAAQKHVEELARYDSNFAEAATQIANARATVADISATARHYAENINASPDRLAEIEDRLAALDRLKRKYGRTLAEVIAYGEDVTTKLQEIENRDVLIAEAKKTLAETEHVYTCVASDLTETRTSAARSLEKLAEQQINDLAMKVQFRVEVAPQKEQSFWTAVGWDHVECLIATNAGEPLKPLEEIASGGEMSRVMLALKVSVEEGGADRTRRRIPLPRTLVFDEIDIGIGGRAAEAVGQKLKALASHQQVLCVTHLPQIAAFANQHFLVEKSERDGRTRTQIRQMKEEERTNEIARMISGATVTETSLRHAEQMLKASK
ncbi:DNA repair protein RecN [Terriglobus roseus]|uniref:DNA repair protein RecN n=1 Tax=Terriglobus roseus TaxID=392734 RepID=A0A1H4IY08_9BACT|nr:DNA repair protein RecN [Terriglobus roseus]SEB38228.1 DNA replication and repair protein RecN [Terriglobus roseus]